jgi:hypothetical protein
VRIEERGKLGEFLGPQDQARATHFRKTKQITPQKMNARKINFHPVEQRLCLAASVQIFLFFEISSCIDSCANRSALEHSLSHIKQRTL